MVSRPVWLKPNRKGGGGCEREKKKESSVIIQYLITVLAGDSYIRPAGEEII